ncbi:MAG: tyrosine-type recombinase/integrase [Aeromicrobium sp.]|uniref:tyrosine-type recombinase/integrase n=1 Tax=Aeromicrobium sp. TaxID=1871063 RepID=UPI0039E336F5
MVDQYWSEDTIRERTRYIDYVQRTVDVDAVSLDEHHIRAMLRHDLAPTSRAKYFSHFHSWFGWLEDNGLRPDNPIRHIARPRANRQELQIPTAEHVRALFASGLYRRTRWMVTLAAYQGLRVSEIARVHDRDIDIIGNAMTVLGKGQVKAVLPLHPMIALIVDERIELGLDGWWFPQYVPNRLHAEGGPILGNSVSGTLSAAMRRARCPGSGHSLRHWFATEMLRRGVDVAVIQKLMRHQSLGTTEQYLHVDHRLRRDAIMVLPDLTRPMPLIEPEPATERPASLQPAGACCRCGRECSWC